MLLELAQARGPRRGHRPLEIGALLVEGGDLHRRVHQQLRHPLPTDSHQLSDVLLTRDLRAQHHYLPQTGRQLAQFLQRRLKLEPLLVLDPARVVGVAELRGNALCASAVNRRAWGDGLHHIIDARTGTPVRDVLATWVIAGNATLADGIATALFLTDPPRLLETYRFAFVRMSANAIEASPGFEGELFA